MPDASLIGARIRRDRLYCRNALLRSLPEDVLTWLLPQLERVVLRRRNIVQSSNTAINHVYFIEEGLVSVLADTGEGKTVETRMIGPEGFVGIRVVLGKRGSFHRRTVQIAGSALCMSADKFAQLLGESKPLHHIMLEYVHNVYLQASQLGACNAHHEIRQRLARWLLMAQERCGTDTLPLTHKLLSHALGVRRATVSDCMAALEQQGVLDCSRSLITIADRGKLESASCKCYALIRQSAPLNLGVSALGGPALHRSRRVRLDEVRRISVQHGRRRSE